MTDNNPILQIFARPPKAGEVKTRLIPGLGKEGACAVYDKLLFGTIETALKSFGKANVQLWLTYNDIDFSETINFKYGIQVFEQKGNNLGDKMRYALSQGLLLTKKVLLVGSDCPMITCGHYVKSMAALDESQNVFIPAVDGGYVLIGTTKTNPKCFEGVHWGTETVMQQTISNLEGTQFKVLQPPLRDLDDLEDYQWHQKNNPF